VIALVISSGATAYPSRQPVMLKVFDKPMMLTARSRRPGIDAGETCGRPS